VFMWRATPLDMSTIDAWHMFEIAAHENHRGKRTNAADSALMLVMPVSVRPGTACLLVH